jgi:hypothetical protein
VYDYTNTCSCVAIGNSAFTALEVLLVILVLGLVSGLVSLLQCYRSKTGLFRAPGHLRTQGRKNTEFRQELETMKTKLEQSIKKKTENTPAAAAEQEEDTLLGAENKRNSV